MNNYYGRNEWKKEELSRFWGRIFLSNILIFWASFWWQFLEGMIKNSCEEISLLSKPYSQLSNKPTRAGKQTKFEEKEFNPPTNLCQPPL
jgi:hypothetical protein